MFFKMGENYEQNVPLPTLNKRKRDRLWVRFPLEDIKYLISSYLQSSVEEKRGVQFHYSLSFVPICLQNSAETGNGSILTSAYGSIVNIIIIIR